MEEDQPPTRKVNRGGTRWRKTPIDAQPKDERTRKKTREIRQRKMRPLRLEETKKR